MGREFGVGQDLYDQDLELRRLEYSEARLVVCDSLRLHLEGLLEASGEKANVVKVWEECRRKPEWVEWFEIAYGKELIDFSERGISYLLPISKQFRGESVPAMLYAVGFPLEEAKICLTVFKYLPFQFAEYLTEIREVVVLGPRGSGEAKLFGVDEDGDEARTGLVFSGDLGKKELEGVLEDFTSGGYEIPVSERQPLEESKPSKLLQWVIARVKGKVPLKAA